VSKRKRKSKLPFPCTDAGNAEYIADLFGDVLRYDHKQGRWLIWDRTHRRWREDNCSEIRKFAIAAARRRRRGAARLADTDRSKAEIKWSFESENRHGVEAALELAKGLAPISDTGEGWDADPLQFGVKNGVLDLRTGNLRVERPGDRITKHSPISFDPTAKCPRFDQFLIEIFEDDEALVDYVQRMLGYCLTGLVREQCFFCWEGPGANGKSTLLEVSFYIFGDYAVSLPFSALELANRNSNDLVSLAGARLATASETNEGTRLNEARIKVLTGGDRINARKLYHEGFTFYPTHKLILSFNHKPIIADDSEGMWRRVRSLLFNRIFSQEQQDRDLPEKLKKEAAGILAWAVRGCLRYQELGLNPPPSVLEATAAYRAESDHLGEFIAACLIADPDSSVSSAKLWSRYEQWTFANEEVPLSRKAFASRMLARGYRGARSGHEGTRVWQGIRLAAADTLTHADGRFAESHRERPM
jgi:putative DNA primase/helicase